MLQHFMYLDSRNQTMSKHDFRKCKVLSHIKLISKGRSTWTCCIYITDKLYYKIYEFPLKLLVLHYVSKQLNVGGKTQMFLIAC